MTTHINSRAAYHAMRDAGELQAKELIVLQALEEGPCTRQELPARTGMPINCVAGRVRSLLDKGLIEEVGSRLNQSTRKTNAILSLTPAQLELTA